VKALSLYEPWATLIALGKKRFETRSWGTAYRGPLLICASKKSPGVPYKMIPLLNRISLTVNEWNEGRALAIADLIDVIKMVEDNILTINDMVQGGNELAFGDFSPGRFAWRLENIRRFVNPPLVRGKQGLFNVPDDLIKNLDTYDPI